MAQEAGKLDHPRRRERLNARTCADQEHGGEVDHPRRTGRLRALTRSDQEHGGVADHPHCSRRNRAQTCADQEYNGENTNEVDRSSRRRLEPQSSLDQEADGEADCPRYNLRLRSRPVVRKESKVPNMVKKPKNEYFLYIDYYREKQKANGRKLNAPNASREAMWMWRKMSDADKAPYKAEAKRLSAEYKEKKRRMSRSSPEAVPTPTLVIDTTPHVITTPPALIGTPPAVHGTPPAVIVTPPAVNGTPPAVNNTPLEEASVSDPSWIQDQPAPQVSMYVSTGPEVSSDSKSGFKKGKGDGVRPSPPSVNRPALRRDRK